MKEDGEAGPANGRREESTPQKTPQTSLRDDSNPPGTIVIAPKETPAKGSSLQFLESFLFT